jgi:hypothetical protein
MHIRICSWVLFFKKTNKKIQAKNHLYIRITGYILGILIEGFYCDLEDLLGIVIVLAWSATSHPTKRNPFMFILSFYQQTYIVI